MNAEQKELENRDARIIETKEAMPVRSLGDLKRLDGLVQEICEGLSHPIGSILRIPFQYLVNWGVEVDLDNAGEIERLSLESYHKEWETSIDSTYAAIQAATRRAGFRKDNHDLSDAVGRLAMNVLRNMMEAEPTREFRLADVGAGEGQTTASVLDYMYFDIVRGVIRPEVLERCRFELIEPSTRALYNPGGEEAGGADQRLRMHPINKYGRLNFTIIGNATHEFLTEMTPGIFDMAISSAVCHHMAFPTYLDVIAGSLGKDGVLVIGDWYTKMWKYPAFVAEVLEGLNMDQTRLREFKQLFSIREGELERRLRKLDEDTEREQTVHRLVREYIVEIGREFIANNVPPESRLFFLEAHEEFGDRIGKVRDAGFVYGLDELRKKHKGFASMRYNRIDLEPDNRCARAFAAAKVAGRRKRRRSSAPPPKRRSSAPPLRS